MPRTCALLLVSFLAFSAPVSLQAQGKDRFVESLEHFSNAVAGAHGDEGPVLASSVDVMQQALREWDSRIASVESRFAAEIGAAPPPAAARMRTALGTVYLERGRAGEALVLFDAASALDPQFADVQLLKGLALESINGPSEASPAYRALWERAPGLPAHAYLFLRAARDADPPSTLQPAREALEAAAAATSPSGGGPLFPTAHIVDDASVSAPVFAPASYADALAALRAGDLAGAVSRLRDVVRADPLVADAGLRDASVREAMAALKRGSPEALASLAGAASRLGSSEVHRVAGLAYRDRKQHDESLAQLRAAVRLNPNNERARLALADVLVDAGDPAAARAALIEAAAAIPGSSLAAWTLALLSQRMGDEHGALEAFEAAAAGPSIAGASHVHAAIGRLYHNQLDLDAAAAAYERRTALTPNDSAAHVDLGDVYRAQGRLDAAMEEFLVAALLDPSNAKALASIGQMHASNGRDEDAVAMLRRAAALDPAHLEARYALSRALTRLGRSDEAKQELEIFQALQAKALEEERRRFRANQGKIEEALKEGEPAGGVR